MLPTIDQLLVTADQSLRAALLTIDRNAQGICFVVDPQTRRLLGSVSDGDVRRALLKGTTLEAPVTDALQRQCVALPVDSPAEEVQGRLSSRIRHIPLLDADGCPVDYACAHKVHRVQLMEPSLSGNELAYVTDCVRTNWISSQGAYVQRFERALADFCGAQFALAVSNGTVALHLALEALGIGPGDEVIVPDFTFAASANAVLHAGATPVLVDVSRDTWTLDIEAARALITPKTRAIMPVHLYGHPAHVDEILALAKEFSLFVVEDAAEALGSRYKGRPIGSFGNVAAFSFFGNKTITTGEGGMIIFRDRVPYERALMLRDHGMSRTKRYWHEVIGYNYRLTNLQAAIGVAQMERVEEIVARKRKIGTIYNQHFAHLAGIELPPEQPWADSTFWLYTILVDPSVLGIDRDETIKKLMLNGIETRPVFYPLHEMPAYRSYLRPGQQFPVTSHLSKVGMSLPSAITLSDSTLRNIAQALQSVLRVRHFVEEGRSA